MTDNDLNAPNFTRSGVRNKPRITYKGGSGGNSAVLSGLVEPKVESKLTGNVITGFEDAFFVKRKIGGKKVNGRKIKGWKEVPTVLNWDSTYRHSEWFENFDKLTEMFRNNKFSDLLKTGEDLSEKDMNYNHALTVFVNSFFTRECKYMSNEFPAVEQLFEIMELDEVIQQHANEIYLNDNYRNDERSEVIEIDGRKRIVKYDDFKMITYTQIVEMWFNYQDIMEEMKVHQADMVREEILSIDVLHRWKSQYTNTMLAKFINLEESRFSDMWTTMLTLTTYQDKNDGVPETPEDWQKQRGASWFEAMERLKDSLDKVLNVLRKIANRELETELHYVWVVEAHKTGYPHIHIAIFGDISEWLNTHKNKLRIKEILEEKHDLGKSGIATEFDTKPPSGDGAINDISNYLMKYIKKNFGEIISKYEDEDLTDKEWGTLVYNACMWLSGYRTWGTSKEVGSVMKLEDSDSQTEYEKLGGELTSDDSKDFRTTINAKGGELLNTRIEQRDKFRNAISKRQKG